MTIIETLVQNHPVRKTKAQKASFREWFAKEAAGMGYTADVHTKGSSNNIVIGRPEAAAVTYTAHYDTPPVMPFPNFITPKNVLCYLLYQLVLVLGFFVLAFVVGFLATRLTGIPELGSFAGFVSVYVLLGLMLFGPANKNCVNDNTSGVAAVMEIMSRLPESERGKVAFILFDNEEKGMLGSSAYASQHKAFKKNGLLINLDCVGDGEHIFFFTGKKTRELPQYALLCETVEAQEGRIPHMEKMESAIYPSDQAQFTHGIAVCACNQMKVIGYYVDKIHTPKDTVCDQANMDFLGESLTRFACALEAPAAEPAAAEAPAAAKKNKWLSALAGLLAAILGMALLMVYIKSKGEMPTIMLIAGAILFGFGFVGFIGQSFKKDE